MSQERSESRSLPSVGHKWSGPYSDRLDFTVDGVVLEIHEIEEMLRTALAARSETGDRKALEEIANFTPRIHNGRSRTFINWQDAFGAVQHIAKKAIK